MKVTAVLSILVAAADAASLLAERQNPAGTSKVNLASKTGPATFLGSGFIYGWPDNGSDADKSIPDYLAQDIKFQASRAGGAQTPSRGWAYGGQAQYAPRFRSTLSNYKTTRKFNGTFILMIHDLWGNDGSTTQQTLHPGDNNDWSGMENFLKQLVSDIKANNMLEGLVIDIWNEPELNIFWSRTWDQFLNYYSRATKYLRTQLPNTLISGPSAAHSPSTTRSTWDTWVSRIVKDNVVPDIYSWHQIGDWEREPARTLPDFDTMRNKYKAPVRPIDINEYASSAEQNPGTTAFFLSQCERYNMRCLRSNWGGGSNLHNWMGALVYKTGNTYFPNGEWQLYKYYANMVGTRVATTLSTDLIFDSFAVVNGKSVKIIAGTRLKQRAYQLSISGLTSIGLPAQGSVSVRTLRFDFSGAKTEITKPVDLGVKSMSYSGDTLSILQNPPTDSTAYAYEFSGV